MFKGENLLDMEPEDRSIAGLFMSFQSPVEIPGVSNIDFLLMAYNARRRKQGLPELSPIEVHVHVFELQISIYCVSYKISITWPSYVLILVSYIKLLS